MTDEAQAALEVLARRHHGLQVMVEAVRQAVGEARQAGASWAEIAVVVGLSEDDARAMFDDGG